MKIEDMSIKDIGKLEKYIHFKNQAMELYNLVVKNQKVGLLACSKGGYVIWRDSYNSEYLQYENSQWVWVADYLHQYYRVPIDLNSIYSMMVRAYEWEINPEKIGMVNKDRNALEYFRAYARKLKN